MTIEQQQGAIRELESLDWNFGRETEQESIRHALKEFEKGKATLIQVSGVQGIGKSSFVRSQFSDYHQFAFFSGKYDRLQPAVPYSGISQIIEDIFFTKRSKNEAVFKDFQQRLNTRFAKHLEELKSVAPAISAYLNTDSSPTKYNESPTDLRNRINSVLHDFFLFCANEFRHPFVLFLDDIQWMDKASIHFLEHFVQHQPKEVLVVLASKGDKDIEWIKLVVDGFSDSSYFCIIRLGPLSSSAIHNFLDSFLGLDTAELERFSSSIYEHCGGNPLVLFETLSDLIRAEELVYIEESEQWSWTINDSTNISGQQPLVTLLTHRLEQLSEESLEVLRLSSCFGPNLNIPFITKITGISPDQLDTVFNTAKHLGILIHSDQNEEERSDSPNFEFAHDIVQETVQHSLNNEEKIKIHKKIADYYISDSLMGLHDRDVYDAVYHINEAISPTDSEDDKRLHIELNLRAARKAKLAASFELSLHYLQQIFAQSNLDWKSLYELTAEVYIEGYQVSRIAGDKLEAQQLFDEAQRHCKPYEMAKLWLGKVVLDIQDGELQEAKEGGTKALHLLGLRLPAKGSTLLVGIEYLKTRLAMRGKSPEHLYGLPKMTDRDAELALRIIYWMFRSLQSLSPELNGILALKQLQLTLKKGTNDQSYTGLMAYGVIIGAGTNNYKLAYEFCEVGNKLAEKYGNDSGDVEFGKAIYSAYRHPLRNTIEHYERAKLKSYDSGDFIASAEPTVNESLVYLSAGYPLNQVLAKMIENRDYCQQLAMRDFYEFQKVVYYNTLLLQGASLTEVQEKDLDSIIDTTQYQLTSAVHGILSLQLSCLRGDWQRSMERMRQIENKIAPVTGLFIQTEYFFYRAIAELKSYDKLGFMGKMKVKRDVKTILRKFYKWAESAPENHLHRLMIIEGLEAEIHGKFEKAQELLTKAIEHSDSMDMPQNTALAHLFLADVLRKMNNSVSAEQQWELANSLFDQWGTSIRQAAH